MTLPLGQRASCPLRKRSSSEQIGVCAGVGKRQNEFACGRVEIEQYPIVFDVTVAESFKVADPLRLHLTGKAAILAAISETLGLDIGNIPALATFPKIPA